MIKKLLASILICSLFFSAGCDGLKLKDGGDNKAVVVVEYSDDSKAIAKSMANVTEADAKVMYMQFSGLSEYMARTTKINKTSDLMKVIDSFQQDYGWTREKYKDYTDSVEAFLLRRGYKTPKTIVNQVSGDKEISRSQVIKDMKELGDAAKIALEAMNAKI